jgi:hypothetical protein
MGDIAVLRIEGRCSKGKERKKYPSSLLGYYLLSTNPSHGHWGPVYGNIDGV